ncbi:unnamed protein product [Arctogadus glacialis]
MAVMEIGGYRTASRSSSSAALGREQTDSDGHPGGPTLPHAGASCTAQSLFSLHSVQLPPKHEIPCPSLLQKRRRRGYVSRRDPAEERRRVTEGRRRRTRSRRRPEREEKGAEPGGRGHIGQRPGTVRAAGGCGRGGRRRGATWWRRRHDRAVLGGRRRRRRREALSSPDARAGPMAPWLATPSPSGVALRAAPPLPLRLHPREPGHGGGVGWSGGGPTSGGGGRGLAEDPPAPPGGWSAVAHTQKNGASTTGTEPARRQGKEPRTCLLHSTPVVVVVPPPPAVRRQPPSPQRTYAPSARSAVVHRASSTRVRLRRAAGHAQALVSAEHEDVPGPNAPPCRRAGPPATSPPRDHTGEGEADPMRKMKGSKRNKFPPHASPLPSRTTAAPT